ncbi:MAG: hypothetical protein AAGA75_05980 [Cyanobacteria bacterium P01_E01_bin.6]
MKTIAVGVDAYQKKQNHLFKASASTSVTTVTSGTELASLHKFLTYYRQNHKSFPVFPDGHGRSK